jgi:hypothetical protein
LGLLRYSPREAASSPCAPCASFSCKLPSRSHPFPPARAAAPRLAEIEAALDDTWFAWSGPTDTAPGKNITAYYRIQGPKLVIEYAPQRGSDPALHVHAMYRDPTNDYGRSPAAK